MEKQELMSSLTFGGELNPDHAVGVIVAAHEARLNNALESARLVYTRCKQEIERLEREKRSHEQARVNEHVRHAAQSAKLSVPAQFEATCHRHNDDIHASWKTGKIEVSITVPLPRNWESDPVSRQLDRRIERQQAYLSEVGEHIRQLKLQESKMAYYDRQARAIVARRALSTTEDGQKFLASVQDTVLFELPTLPALRCS